jgi:hypothetical protein
MQTLTNANFGPLVAYLVPGATVLAGLSPFSPTIQSWLAGGPLGEPTLGGFLYLTVAALAAGMTVSAVRWAVVDTLHGWTGLRMPPLDFSRLGPNVGAFQLLIEIHYKHYLFHANMVVAGAVAYASYRVHLGSVWPLGWPDLLFLCGEAVFWATSRDNLRKYYARSRQLLCGAEAAGPTPRRGQNHPKRRAQNNAARPGTNVPRPG